VERNPEARTREMRQLMILAVLRGSLPRQPAPDEIKYCLYPSYPGTGGEAIHRRFSEDMAGLRRAGLIDYDDLRPSRRVTLTAPQKDSALYLTLEEHRALKEARHRLNWKPAPSPFSGEAGTEKLAHVVRALRLIEEGNTEVADLAEALEVRPRKIHQILERLDGIRPVADALAELVLERNPVHQRPEAAHIRVGSSAERPLAERGLDEIGLFAYSREEVDDRVALIDAALDAGAPDRDAVALRSARRKLTAWRDRLEQT
jgi:hypothetical protein